MWPLSLAFGVIVGFSLGLTGGGGSLLAVPLLVYGLSMAPPDAIGVSLASVGMTAVIGTVGRLRRGQVEVRTGLIFATSGIMGAPAGAWLSGKIDHDSLLIGFAVLMLTAATRMWFAANVPQPNCDPEDARGPTCRRDATGTLILNSRCAVLLLLVGLATGVLSGLFGVGGGFIIVPALMFFSGMTIHRAIATSLMIVALVSGSALAAHLLGGRDIQPVIALTFVAGGVVGLTIGKHVVQYLSAPALRKVFAAAIVVVGIFVLVKTIYEL